MRAYDLYKEGIITESEYILMHQEETIEDSTFEPETESRLDYEDVKRLTD